MPLFHILVLAIIQGITEFLPISSSGHLLMLPILAGWEDQGQSIDIAVHVGTLIAVIAYFRQDIIDIIRGFLLPMSTGAAEQRRLGLHILVASLPIVIVGGLLYYFLRDEMRSLLLVAGTTIIFGALLGYADRHFKVTRSLNDIRWSDSLIIGLFQVLSLLPGTSRSGITMTAARMRGFSRTDGAHFSILLSIPTILGAGTLAIYHLVKAGDIEVGIDALLAAVISCVVAFMSISLLMRWIEKIGYMPFVYYRIVMGAVLLVIYFVT